MTDTKSAYCTYPNCECVAPHASDKFEPKKPTKIGPFEKIGADIGRLVEAKQLAYGDSFGKAGDVMRILYPEGVPPEKLDDALTVVRVLDKLFRIATAKDAFGESPWRDIAGYSLLAVRRDEEDPRSPQTQAVIKGIAKELKEVKAKE